MKRDKPKIRQFLLTCTIDELVEVMPVLLKKYGFKMDFIPSNTFPLAVDFEEKVIFTVNKPSIIAPYLQSGKRFLTFDDFKKVLNVKYKQKKISRKVD